MTAPAVFEGISGPFASGSGPIQVPYPAENPDLPGARVAVLLAQTPNVFHDPSLLLPTPAGFLPLVAGLGIGSGTVTHVGTAVPNEANPATGFTYTIPAGTVAGDDLYASVLSREHGAAQAAPTMVDNDVGGGTWQKIFEVTSKKTTLWWKKATANTAGKTVTVAGCQGVASGVLSVYRGGAPVPHLDTAGNILVGQTENDPADWTSTGFIPPYADSMICLTLHDKGGAFTHDSPACSDPGPLIKRGEKLSTTVDGSCSAMHASGVQSGGPRSTGDFTWQASGSGSRPTTALTWAIRPQPAGTKLWAWWARPGANPAPPTIQPTIDHILAYLITAKRCRSSGFPFDLVAGNTQATLQAVAIPGGTLDEDNAFALAIVAHAISGTVGRVNGWTNLGFVAGSLIERGDGSTAIGIGGGIGIATGVKAAKGVLAATVAQLTAPSNQAHLLLALLPEAVGATIELDYSFLTVQDPADPASEIALKVVQGSFREEAHSVQGRRRRSQMGNWLSTLRNIRRRWRCTVEFFSGGDLEAFLSMIDVSTVPGVYAGPRPVYLTGDLALPEHTALRGRPPVLATIEVMQQTPFEHVAPAQVGGTTYPGYRHTGWTVDLVIEAV